MNDHNGHDQTGTALLDPPASVSDPALEAGEEPSISIEPARWEDARQVVQIIRSSAEWYEEFVAPEDMDEHFVDLDWARENFQRREFYVARLGGEIAGTISLQEVGDDHLYLGYVYLHTDHVGNGFGGDLLDFARDELKRRGRHSMFLIAHPEAIWAKRAYLRYGFEITAKSDEEVLEWNDGWLEPYHEEGFQLYEYRL